VRSLLDFAIAKDIGFVVYLSSEQSSFGPIEKSAVSRLNECSSNIGILTKCKQNTLFLFYRFCLEKKKT